MKMWIVSFDLLDLIFMEFQTTLNLKDHDEINNINLSG